MIYQVTYKDKSGNPLLEVTMNADDPMDLLEQMASTPSCEPPPGTDNIDVRRIE